MDPATANSRRCFVRALGGLLLASWLPSMANAAVDSAYAVQATATVQSAPPQITLAWTAGPAMANGYAISRKQGNAGAWSPLVNLPGNASAYTDANVTVGQLYEYEIIRQGAGYTGHGYVASGIDLPVVDGRGRVILIVDQVFAGSLAVEIDRLVSDLVGDGWMVSRHDVSRQDPPAVVRQVIRSDYQADPANTRAVLLLGHVAVAFSGHLNLDGHGQRPMPTDAYYGDMDGNWTDVNSDGVLDQDRIPSDVELMVGRIDFADMPGTRSVTPFPTETELLRRYLGKDHDFRHAVRRVAARALVGDRFGDANGEAFGAIAYRTFPALLGPGRMTSANVEDKSPATERWLARLTGADWLWVYGAGGGDNDLISSLGLHGQYFDVWSVDLVDQRARGTFYLLFGSRLVDWSKSDNIMRAALAAPDYGLTAAWAGRPHLFLHHMAMGEPIGYGIRLSQNNSTLYGNQVNLETRGIHLALMGDPTLRMQVVAPPGPVTVAPGAGPPVLSWTASPDAAAGYHVYRATSDGGPFSRVTDSPVMSTSHTDVTAPVGEFIYMVRAVRREVSGSGTYFNLSQGSFARVSVAQPAPTPPAPATPAPPPPSDPTPPVPVTPTPPPPAPTGGSGGSAGGGGGAPSLWFTLALAMLALARRGKPGIVKTEKREILNLEI